MTTQTNRELLSKIINENIKHSNYNQQNHNAKQFMDWTGLSYQDIYDDLGKDEYDADHYDILMSHFLPSMTDGEIEITLDGIYSHLFDDHRSKCMDRNYDALVDDMIALG